MTGDRHEMAGQNATDRYGAPADRKAFAEACGRWREAIIRSDLPDAAVRIGLAVGLRISFANGWAWPSYQTISEDTGGRSRKSVERAAAQLVRGGWLVRTRRAATGRSAGYTLDWRRWQRPAIPIRGGGEAGIDVSDPPF